MKQRILTFQLGFVALLVVGCSSLSDRRAAEEQGRRVAAGGIYKIGTPYEIEGEWYYPQEDATYDNTGIASGMARNSMGGAPPMAKFLIWIC